MNKSLFVFCVLKTLLSSSLVFASNDAELLDLSLDELSDIKVTSVSKRSESLSNSAAAVFVINNEDIRRSGVTSIPEALRLAPGLNVARIDANQWSVSARGFNGRFANKLLVLIDGRSLYNPSFAGVYWENQDVMIEDVDRIEVIRGPGAALWGSNAVNGVINIITKHTSQTQGGLLALGAGTEERNFGAARYGFQLNETTTGRTYIKGFDRNEMRSTSAKGGAGDDWNEIQGGFRVDSSVSAKDNVTVQGDLYRSAINQRASFIDVNVPGYAYSIHQPVSASGGNVLGRWQHTASATSNYTFQAYFDHYQRNEALVNHLRNNADVDFQHHFILNNWNELVWGLNYRVSAGQMSDGAPHVLQFIPRQRTNQYYSGFLQDQLTLIDRQLWLTLGVKLEHNDFTGLEVQPTARVMWEPHEQHRFWGAVSRGVRIPSLLDNDSLLAGNVQAPNSAKTPNPLPTLVTVQGSSYFRSEQVLAYELGYRFLANNDLTLDATAFYNDYSTLRNLTALDSNLVLSPTPYINYPVEATNTNSGYTYGAEASLQWRMLDWWRWDVNYSYIHTNLTASNFYKESTPPQNQLSLRAMLNPVADVTFDTWLRFVDKSQSYTLSGLVDVDAYATLDLRLAWKAQRNLELSITGQNLVDSQHLEYVKEAYTAPTAIQRGVYGKIMWSF